MRLFAHSVAVAGSCAVTHARSRVFGPATSGTPHTALAFCFHSGLASAWFVTGFQPWLAMVVLGHMDPWASASMLFVVWKVYLLDRLTPNAEDQQHSSRDSAVSFASPLWSRTPPGSSHER